MPCWSSPSPKTSSSRASRPVAAPTTPRTSSATGCRCTATRPSRCWSTTPTTTCKPWMPSALWTRCSPGHYERSASSSIMGLPGLRSRRVVPQRTPAELDAMAAAGALVASALAAVKDAAVPGVSTLALDEIAESVIRDGGGIPSFLGYHGFPASICSSVNDRVVHGIPSASETLASGDLVSIDCGAILDGWHGDSAITFGIGSLIPVDEALSAATREAMEAGIAAMVPGNRLTDVAHALEAGTDAAEARYDRKLGIVARYGGHGIGRRMLMDPVLPNEGAPG